MSGPSLHASRWAPGGRQANNTYGNNNNNRQLLAPTTTTTSNSTSNNQIQHQSPSSRSRSTSPFKASTTQPHPTIVPLVKATKYQRDLQNKHQEFSKFNKLLRRLKWKSTILFFSFQRVFQHIYNEQHQHEHESRESLLDGGRSRVRLVNQLDYHMPASEAETMFKIDFFEFYILLERVLVHLLGTFGVLVSAAYGAGDVRVVDGDGSRRSGTGDDVFGDNVAPVGRDSIVGDSRSFGGHAHRFHANVLAALDVPSLPLHSVLGTGQVRDYLGIAKEFRNRWKDAEEKEKNEADDGLLGSRYEKLLKDLKVESMLESILVAVEKGGGLAAEYLTRLNDEEEVTVTGTGVAGIDQGSSDMQLDHQEEKPWEAMPDAMDID